MNCKIKPELYRLHVFHEGRKRRVFVGELIYLKEKDRYEFIYDRDYVNSKSAIPVGADLDLFKLHHKSPKGKLFSSFLDRIPLKANPAYEDYCKSEGISPDEPNQIMLLGTIGKRGPSSFVFEPVYRAEFSILDLKKFRETLQITQHDFAEAFSINLLTLRKMEFGKSQDYNTLKRVQIYFQFPEVALWQLQQTKGKIHSSAYSKLTEYFWQQTEK